MSKTIPLCKTSIKKAVESGIGRKYRFPAYTLPSEIAFDVSLIVDDKLHEKIETDDKLANAIFASVSNHFKAAQNDILTMFMDAEKEALDLRRRIPPTAALKSYEKKRPVLEGKVRSILQDYSQKIVDDANTAIDQWQKVRKDRTKYVRKAAIKVTLSTVGVVTGVVGTAGAAASGGYALGVAIYGLAKAVIGMGKQIYSLAIAIDKAEKNLRSDLEGVKRAYLKASKKEVAVKEIAKSVIERVLTYEMKSVSKCEKELDLFVGKLRGIDVKASDYGKKLHQMLDKQEALDRLIAEKEKRQQKEGQYVSKRLPKLKKTLSKLIKATADQIQTMEKLYRRIELGKRNETIYRNALKELQDKKPGWVKYAEMATALIDIALDATALQNEAADIATFCVDIVSELGEIVNEEK